jgi:hypothetical protein
MNKKNYLNIFFLLFFSCTGTKNIAIENTPVDLIGKNNNGTTIKIDNPTGYNVYFDGGQKINKKSNGTVNLLIEEATLTGGFDILYEIPLTATVSLFCKGDHRTIRDKQSSLIINKPQINEIYGTYIVIQNNVNNAISFYTGGTANPSWEQKGNSKLGNNLTWTDKREFSPGETVVFDISRDFSYDNYFIRDSRKNIPLILPKKVEKNNVYTFEYSVKGVELIDSRSLHRIGENSWLKTKELENATSILPFVTDNKEINLFASTSNEGLKRIVYDSAGNIKSTIKSGNSFNITYVSAVKDGFFIAGYEIKSKSNKPIVHLLGADGVTRFVLPESNSTIYESARFLTVAQKDANTWLLAGDGTNPVLISEDGTKKSLVGTTAYARPILYEENKFTVVKEWGAEDFPQYKEIKSSAYNQKNDCWLITGKIIASDSYYLARLNNNGTIQKISEFKEMEIYKILVDTSGNYYLAGQEQKGDGTYAFLVKYDVNNKELWRLSKQPPSNSYYYATLFDIENNRIILAGTLQANDEYGNGGKPFIESVDMSIGTLDWREILSSSVFTGTNLVTAISTAPDYGYVLVLSSVRNGNINKPYKLARINSRGKYLEY